MSEYLEVNKSPEDHESKFNKPPHKKSVETTQNSLAELRLPKQTNEIYKQAQDDSRSMLDGVYDKLNSEIFSKKETTSESPLE
jgi:hypothetical protein